MEIIVIDDGINEDFAHIDKLKYNLEILESLDIVERTDYDKLHFSHGSICANIIKKYASDCEIGSIKVLNSNKRQGSSAQLQKALEWCLNNDIALINMSLGSILYVDYEPIRMLIAKLIRKRCIIIAACHNTRGVSIPACLSGVIGVEANEQYNNEEYSYNNYYLDRADIVASSRHLIHIHTHKTMFTPVANSFATPLITSIVHSIIKKEGHKKVCDIKYKLFRMLNRKENINVCLCMRPDFIDKAIVLNYNDNIERNKFFCAIDEWYDNPNLNRIFLKEDNNNLIIIPPYHEFFDVNFELRLTEFLLKNKDKINGILFGGEMSFEFIELCNKEIRCLIWDENAYYRLFSNIKIPAGNAEIPIVSIVGQKGALELAALLEAEFKNSDYVSLKISDIRYSYLYDFEYVPSLLIDNTIFKYLEEIFNSDVLIFTSNTIKQFNADIQIILKDDSDIERFNESTICINKNSVLIEIKRIFEYIIGILTL